MNPGDYYIDRHCGLPDANALVAYGVDENTASNSFAAPVITGKLCALSQGCKDISFEKSLAFLKKEVRAEPEAGIQFLITVHSRTGR